MLGFIKKWLAKDQEIEVIDTNVRHAFTKVNTDIQQLVSWLDHLHRRDEHLQEQLHSRHLSTAKEIELAHKWIAYLEHSRGQMDQDMKSVRQDLAGLRDEIGRLASSIEAKVSQGALAEVTPIAEGLRPAELRVLEVLLTAEQKLSYADISRMVQLNYGTVKNAIYGLRRQKIPVRDITGPGKEKLFFVVRSEVAKAYPPRV